MDAQDGASEGEGEGEMSQMVIAPDEELAAAPPAPSAEETLDIYAVPQSDAADFVGVGSLGHIIRKCFTEIYYPERARLAAEAEKRALESFAKEIAAESKGGS